MTETSSHRYKPRNIINAPNVKSSIFPGANNAATAKISSAVKQPFLSLIIGDLPHVYPSAPVADYAVYFSPDAEIPAGWCQSCGDERFLLPLTFVLTATRGNGKRFSEFLRVRKRTRN